MEEIPEDFDATGFCYKYENESGHGRGTPPPRAHDADDDDGYEGGDGKKGGRGVSETNVVVIVLAFTDA